MANENKVLGRKFIGQGDLQGLSGDAIIDLWTVDLKNIDPDVDVLDRWIRFCNWGQTSGNSVKYGNILFEPIPYEANGFEYRSNGAPPSPKMIISNLGTQFLDRIEKWDDLVGAKVIRVKVLRKHLDDGSNPNTNAHWPAEVWYIQQKSTENRVFLEWTLSTSLDLDGVRLPGRRALKYTCPFIYRGAGCEYTGVGVADAWDRPVITQALAPGPGSRAEGRIWYDTVNKKYFIYDGANWVEIKDDICSKTLTGCRMRFGEDDLPFGGFPGLSL